jgi:hypothetical protein
MKLKFLQHYDFEHVWSRLKLLCSRSENEAFRGLSDRLISNRPPYWRPWGELDSRERPRVFQKLQVGSSLFLFPFHHVDSSQGRRRFIDKGEIPPDCELNEGSKEVPIDLEVSPQELNLIPGAVKLPTTKLWIHAGEPTLKRSTPNMLTSQHLEVPHDTASPVNSPSSIPQAVPTSMDGRVPSAGSAPFEEGGMRTVSPITSTTESHKSNMNTFPVTTGLASSDDPVLAVVSSIQHVSPVNLLPKIKTEHKKAPKRPAEFIDLTISKRQVHKKVQNPSMITLDVSSPQSSLQVTTNHDSMAGNTLFPATTSSPLMLPSFTPIIQKSTVQPFTVDVDNHIPLHSSPAVALENETGAEAGTKILKRDPGVGREVEVNQSAPSSVELDDELYGLEEEAERAANELEDALRVAEARRQMNSVKRRIDQLRGRGRSFI